MVQRVALTAAAIDVGYIGLFLWLGSVPLAAVNLVSIAMYAGAYLLIKARHNMVALTLIWLEVVAHAALGSLIIGWDSGFHYFLLLFIPTIVIANTRGYATPLVLLLLAYYLGLRAMCDWLGPLAPLPPLSVKWVNGLHITLVFGMMAALAAFYRRTVLIAEDRLRKQATLDPLTGLNNRSHFETLTAHVLARSQRDGTPVALLLCDVDHFKRVNDTYGHEAGDEVLRRLARTLQERLRASDVVARLGGEEFVVLLPDTDLAGTQAIANALVKAMAEQQDPVVGTITVSAGVASMRGVQDTGTDILRRGDGALYEAKGQGRNRVCVET